VFKILGKKFKGFRRHLGKIILGRENLSECLKFWQKNSRAPAALHKMQCFRGWKISNCFTSFWLKFYKSTKKQEWIM